MTCEILIQTLIAIILFLTFLTVVKYVRATKNLWKETVKQTEEMVRQTRLSMRPIVVVTYDEGESKFMFINYGNTPAFNIKIDDVTLINTEGLKFYYVFPEEYCVPQSTKISIENIKKKINDEISDTDTFDLGALIPFSAHRTFDIKIRYKNAESEEYITEGKVGEGTFDITRIEKIS